MEQLRGTGVALITPFKKDLSIDFDALENLVAHVTDGGVEYLVVLGTTGESATLDAKETASVKDCIYQANAGKLPMVLGMGGNNTQAVCDNIRSIDLSNYDAILSVSPYYNKPSQEGVYQHFKAVASHSEKPIILYNVPGRTSSNMSSETTLRLAHEVENIVAIKEASPNFLQSIEIIKDRPEGFLVLSGDDELALPMALAGGDGVISVIGQGIPQIYSETIRLGLEKQADAAYMLHYQYMNLMRTIYDEGNPAGIKALLALCDLCEPTVRLPLMPATEALKAKIQKLLEDLG